MTDFNIVNLKQGVGLPGASKKLRKGNTGLPVRRQTGKEHGQLMPFACIMGHACRIATQKTEKILLNFLPGKGKQNNILGAGKDKTEKTNQSLPVKGKGLAENPHGVILKGGATKDINRFMSASKGKDGIGGQRSEVGGQSSEMADAPGLLKFSLKNAVVVKGKSTVEPAGTEKNTEKNSFISVNNGGKNNIGNSLKHSGLKGEAKAVVRQSALAERTLADEAFKESRGARVADPVGENLRNGKTDAALFKNGKNIAGINNALLRRQSLPAVSLAGSELARRQSGGVKGQKAKMEEKQGLLKSSLKNAAAVKGKSAVEPAITEKNSFTPVNSGGKNNIGNLLKPLGLNGEETIKIPHRGTPQPESPSVRGFSAGGHNNTTFHVSGSSSAVNESASSYDIKPRALINQIAKGAKMSGRVRIALNPPRLGTLDVDVLVRDNKVHVILQTENNDVRQILHSNVESLKSSLRSHGLVADTINVSVQDKSDGANHGADYRSAQNETLFKEGKNREGNEEDQSGEQDSLNHDPSSLEEENQSGEHGERISLFA
jgi:flagellar hook-length control protein FliK